MAGRGNWKNWYEFLFSCLGCLVGLGNIWRFPYLCYKNGGGAFLIPYFIFMFICAMPLFLLEMSYPQFSNLGPGKAWICVPLLRGVGIGMVILTGIVSVYYTVIMAWTLYYLGMSFSTTLPWSTCNNKWNTRSCYIRLSSSKLSSGNMSIIDAFNQTDNSTIDSFMNGTKISRKTPTEEFWERNVLEITQGVEHPGYVRWPLLLCLLGAWILVFLSLVKGIKSSGKVMYVASTVPYLLLTILLVRGSMNDGAWEGFKFYAVPQFDKLLSFSVWCDAAVQMFYSAGLGFGGISTLASYNSFHNNVQRDAIMLPILDCFTSWCAGVVIFVNLGFMAKSAGLNIDDVVSQGPGIAFMVYPEALSQLPIPQLWSVLFFLMLFMVGLNTQIVHVQTITSALSDIFTKQLINRKLIVTFVVCLSLFLCGISCITQGGVYFLQILDWYSASISCMFLALTEIVGIVWIYGIKKLTADIELMIGFRLNKIWSVFLQFITPMVIVMIWVFNIIQLTPVRYGTVTYPFWAISIGWIVASIAIVPLPVGMLRQIYKAKGSTLKEKVINSIRPSADWRPAESISQDQYLAMIRTNCD